MKKRETSRAVDKELLVNNKLFLNPERVSMPDIDVDIADDRRSDLYSRSFDELCSPSVYDVIDNVILKKEKEPETKMTTKTTYSIPEVNNIVHNKAKGTTTVHWEDGTKTSVRIMEGDTYDEYSAFCAACCKKLFGSSTMAKRIHDRKNIEFIKAARQQEIKQREQAAAERRAIQERREAKRIARQVQREDRISAMVDEILK